MIGYKYFSFDALGEIVLTLRGNANGTLYISTEESGAEIGQTAVCLHTDQWTDFRIPVQSISGKKALFFHYSGEGALDVLQFTLENS